MRKVIFLVEPGTDTTWMREPMASWLEAFEFAETLPEDSSAALVSLAPRYTKQLAVEGRPFFNWDLLFSILGPNDRAEDLRGKLEERLRILKDVLSIGESPRMAEFHASIRVRDLAASARFYTWLFGLPPKEWTHRYVTFLRRDTGTNFVLLVADGKELHHDTLYHLGIGLETREQVVESYHQACGYGFHVEKPPRTTWRGTPLHELWLKDPDGNLVELYARLTEEELTRMPADKEP
ncbi:MAG TPA: VOC family protein, partial [Myxococcaceae bacterium]|nr:VOC family protein [Myxococcaceae bacterium]